MVAFWKDVATKVNRLLPMTSRPLIPNLGTPSFEGFVDEVLPQAQARASPRGRG